MHDQELAIDGIALARAIDVHASLVQDTLTQRELMARFASNQFRAPSVINANMLQPLRSSIYAFKTDFVIASWIARLKPTDLDAASKGLAAAGFPNPTIRNYDDKPLDAELASKPINVVMDVEPLNATTTALAGRALDQNPIIGPMLAMAEGTIASDPIPLLRKDGPIGIVLAAPVTPEGATTPAGFVTFSYELAPLMLANDDLSLFSVVLKDPRSADSELIANDQYVVTSRTAAPDAPLPSATRTVTFGNRDWPLSYYAKINAAKRAQQTAVITGATIMILGALLLGFVVSWMR